MSSPTDYRAKLQPNIKKRKYSAIQPNYYAKVPDPFDSRYYTIYRFFVPMPMQVDDEVCILACVRNAREAVFQRFSTVQSLSEVFMVPDDHFTGLEQALDTARLAKIIIEDLERQKIEKISALPSPSKPQAQPVY